MIFRLDKDTVTPELKRLAKEISRPRSLIEAGAKAVQSEISKHLKTLQARGNAKGWPSQKFFHGKATSVEKQVGIASLTDTNAVITIADPRFVHRIEGGTVTPKRAKALAIPLTAEAYAKAGKGSIRGSMPGLKLIVTKRGAFLVRETEARTTAGASGGRKYNKVKSIRIFPMFKLVKSVTHRPHPEELPDHIMLSVAAGQAMIKAAKLMLGK